LVLEAMVLQLLHCVVLTVLILYSQQLLLPEVVVVGLELVNFRVQMVVQAAVLEIKIIQILVEAQETRQALAHLKEIMAVHAMLLGKERLLAVGVVAQVQ
jgi:hypothetical protein